VVWCVQSRNGPHTTSAYFSVSRVHKSIARWAHTLVKWSRSGSTSGMPLKLRLMTVLKTFIIIIIIIKLSLNFAPRRDVTYYDEYVCVFVCLSIHLHNLKTTWPNFIRFFVHVASDCCSVLLWWLPVLWMTLEANQNLNWINSDSWYHCLVLTNKDISLIVRGRLYSSYVQSSMSHGSETWPARKENEVALQLAEMRMFRWMCGIKLQDIHVRGWERDWQTVR